MKKKKSSSSSSSSDSEDEPKKTVAVPKPTTVKSPAGTYSVVEWMQKFDFFAVLNKKKSSSSSSSDSDEEPKKATPVLKPTTAKLPIGMPLM